MDIYFKIPIPGKNRYQWMRSNMHSLPEMKYLTGFYHVRDNCIIYQNTLCHY